ncbi:MAG TPA: MBL fold metallo-hydrolase [Streptosporangiaceae bacterium]
MIDIVVIETPSLGDRSYLLTDGASALVIDPQRDIDRVLDAAAARGAVITHVAETHLHNDYLSGGLALARRTGAAYHVNAEDTVGFNRVPASDGDEFAVGERMRVRVVATPGHTFTHLAYVLSDAATGEVAGVFTGGSLLYGTTGRPDLLGAEHARVLAAAQHDSARRLAGLLPDSTPVYPTHGFGSLCAVAPATVSASTIGEQKLANPAFLAGQQDFVDDLIAGLDEYPAYYAHMGPANAAGAPPASLSEPELLTGSEIARRVAAGDWVIDLRARRRFAAGHVPGTLGFELGDGLATYLGWLIPWTAPLTLLADEPGQIAAAQLQLARIGMEQVTGAATGDPQAWADGGRLTGYPVGDFAGLATVLGRSPVTVLDVRRRGEWAAGHIVGATHLPLHDLPGWLTGTATRPAEQPGWPGQLAGLAAGPVWVHCQAGYRAAVAASFLHAAGYGVTAIDDDFGHAERAGLPLAAGLGSGSGAGP